MINSSSETSYRPVFFPGSHPRLWEKMHRFLEDMRRQLDQHGQDLRVAALALAGGYGRGEGGVYMDEDGDALLYNDVEFYLFTHGAASERLLRWVQNVEHAGRTGFGVPVEIKVLPVDWLFKAEPSMFLYDLVVGHRIVYGPADFLREEALRPLHDSNRIPLHEATRLLFNRGSGLLFSAAKLSVIDSEWDAGFIERNHAKVKLALGDAVLVVNGLYDSSCRERNRRLTPRLLQKPPCWSEVQRLHAAGVGFKLHPRHEHSLPQHFRQTQGDLVRLWSEVFLWLESLRLGVRFADLSAYAQYPGRLLPEFSAARNFSLRVRDTIRHRERLPYPFDHPRAVLQRALAAFLQPNDGTVDLAAGQKVLGVSEDASFETYRRWWGRYN